MTIRLLLAFVLVPLWGAAQTTALNRKVNVIYGAEYYLVPPDANGLQGNAFLLPDWQPATVLLVGNASPTATHLRYDVYRQELRVRRPQGDSVVVPLNRIVEFTLTNPARRFVCYPAALLPAEVAGACAEVLADGAQLQLLKFWHKAIVKQSMGGGSYAAANTTDALEESTRYYLRWPADGHLTALRLKRGSLEQALAGQSAALAALKARKGSLSSEADMIAAVTALDSTVGAGH